MASGLIPVMWRLVRARAVTVVDDKRQLILNALMLLFVLYFTYETAFVIDGDASDTIAASATPFMLQGLYLFFPIGVFLFALLRKSFTKHVILGISMSVVFGLPAFGVLIISLMQVFFVGNVTASLIYLIGLVQVLYDMRHNTGQIFANMGHVFIALFIGAFLAIPLDWAFSHSVRYQAVIADAQAHMPANISLSADDFTIHYYLWFGAIMLLCMNVFRSIRLRSVEELQALQGKGGITV